MPIESGWEVSKDRKGEWVKMKLAFQANEDPLLTTKMKRSRWGGGFAVLTNQNLWWVKHVSKLESLVDSVYELDHLHSVGYDRDKLHRSDRTVPGTTRKLFSLYNILKFEHRGKGLYILYWLKFSRKGAPKVDKNRNYKTSKVAYRLLPHKGEDEFRYIERREQFGYFLQKVIDDLPEDQMKYASMV